MLALIFASTYLRNMIARRDVYQAIADPTRRSIINMIAAEPHNINAIAGKFDMTQQGRDRLCEAHLGQLSEVAAWVEAYRQHWENKLDTLETYIEKLKIERHG